jgi:hypothetical protein
VRDVRRHGGYQARAHREAVAAVKEFLAKTFDLRGE